VTAAFLGDDFLLTTSTARSLYHDAAARVPIIDPHTHLSATEIADDRTYETLTELWLEDDHYKWRAMRSAGVDEALVTGAADPWDRFCAWASTVPRLVRNPLYVWSHLELRRVFGIDLVLSSSTAREVWDEANRQLPRFSARQLLDHFGVEALATTDDPGDDLDGHRRLKEGSGSTVVPTFRPDAAHRLLTDPRAWCSWADRLGSAEATEIEGLDTLLEACTASYQRFQAMGGRASDHGIEVVPDRPRDRALADAAIRRVRDGVAADPGAQEAVALEVVNLAARLASDDGGVLQLHLGAHRDASPRLFDLLGSDVGGDVVGDARQVPGLAGLLGSLEGAGQLPRTVLYNLNPADNVAFATMAGTFSAAGEVSLVQWGPPWWFNDHEAGVRHQLDDLSQVGQLAGFVGMVADSRSLLSFTRHELFRRVLCDVLGRDVEEGRIPADQDLLSAVVLAVCGGNARRFYGLGDGAGGATWI
jgi:glucuronate isomerase